MAVAPSPPPIDASWELDARWELAQRVAASTSFQRSPRLRSLLLYICERAIKNKPEECREQLIGCSVFGRRPDYSPGEDNIVRVEVRQLRKRLDEYFANQGKDSESVIVIPKGAYVPLFEPRERLSQESAPAAAAQAKPARARLLSVWTWSMTATTVTLIVLCVWLWTSNRSLSRHVAASQPAADRSPIWPLLFNDTDETLVVCADSSLVVAQTLMHRAVPLDEYLTRDFVARAPGLPSEVKSVLRDIPNWQFSDVTDVRLVQRLSRLNADHWNKVSIRSAKTTQVQDFKIGNSILLGSNRSNLWNSLFEPSLNFRFEYDQQVMAPYIRNRNPRGGEPTIYRAARPGQSGESYSVVALVPNLRHTGHVLIIEGTTAEGTEAAGEFIMNPATSTPFIKGLMAQNKGRIPNFEVLLRSRTLSGVAKNGDVIAVRILPNEAPGI